MKRILFILTILLFPNLVLATDPPENIPPGTVLQPPSIHQVELEEHNRLPEIPPPPYPLYYSVQPEAYLPELGLRALTRTVYGFLPYWVYTDLTHIRWDLLSHIAFFSLEMDPYGDISATHNWPGGSYVVALRNVAAANNVPLTITATNFSPTGLTTLLSSSTNRQNAIDNLLAQAQAGNADGVNIDFEGVPVSQKANLVTFMADITSAFHSAIPGSHVSVCTPAVDWSGSYDYDQLALNSDGMFIMAYAYHYNGSATAGPCAPRDESTLWGQYSVGWTIDDYITYGGSENRDKFIVGLPYYGFEWPTESETVPSSTTGTGSSMTYSVAKPNAITYGRQWDGYGEGPYYTRSGPYQCFYDDEESLGLKWDLVNANDLGGTGMWALNYDTYDEELWNTLEQKFSPEAGDMTGIDIGIDPGHGGTEPGAVGPTGLTEKEVNLAASLMLRDAMEEKGATVYMTRTDDSTVSLTARTDYLNSIPVDRTESYHHNACGYCEANYTGVHVYWTEASGCGAASANSRDMAEKTALRLDDTLGIGVVSSNCDPSIYGVHGDNFHMVRETSMPAMLTEGSFIDNTGEELLLYTDARRCQVAGAVAKGIEDHYGVTAVDPPCASGACGNPILIDTFPYSDSNTTTGKNEALDGYSCPPSTGSEAGPEVVYLVQVALAGTLTVTVSDGAGVDIDPHLLGACDPGACITRADITFTVFLQPGDYYLVCDTWTSGTGTKYHGDYDLTVTFSADTAAPAEVKNLKWNNDRWEWDETEYDWLDEVETMGYYQMWKADDISAWNFTLLQDHITPTYLDHPDNDLDPDPGVCWYYFLHAVDAAGNRDLPDRTVERIYTDAVYSGSWLLGGSPDCLEGTGQYRYIATAATPTATATWSFDVEETGDYSVSARYVAGVTNRTTVRYTVEHLGGSTEAFIDQTVNNCTWMPLGTFTLQAGNSYTVVLDNEATTGKVAIAEAVMWSK